MASCPLQLATGDHPLVAIVEPERVAVVSAPDGELVAEVGLRADAEGVDVAWLGQPPRLVVVSRLHDCTELHLLDVTAEGGARMCGDRRVEGSMRLMAVNGNYGLLCGATTAAVLTRNEDHLAIHPVAARGLPTAAGALGTQIVVALVGLLEIWDPVARVAKRRLKLPRPAQIRAVGGSERQIWLCTLSEPRRLEVLPLVNRGQPKAHDFDEAIGAIAGHPKLDVAVCAGADSGVLYVVDLEGRYPTRELGADVFGGRPMAMGIVGGRVPAIVAIAAGQPVRTIGFDRLPLGQGRRAATAPGAPMEAPRLGALGERAEATASARDDDASNATVFDSMLGQRVLRPVGERVSDDVEASGAGAVTVLRRGGARDAPEEVRTGPSATLALIDRLSAWREAPPAAAASEPRAASASDEDARSPRDADPRPQPARRDADAGGERPAPGVAAGAAHALRAAPAPPPAAASSWRDAVVRWVSGGERGHLGEPPPLAPRLHELLLRLELPTSLAPALQALYGAHLLGRRAGSAALLAAALGEDRREASWREALGGGALAQSGLLRARRSRVRLAGAARRFLDELPAKHGVLVGAGERPAGPAPAALVCALPADADAARAALEELAGALGGKLLVARAPLRDARHVDKLCREARVRGALAVVPYPWPSLLGGAPLAPALYLAPTAQAAAEAGLSLRDRDR